MKKLSGLVLVFLSSQLAAIPPLSITSSGSGYRISMDIPTPMIQVEQVNGVSSYGEPVNEKFVKAFIYGFDYDGTLGEPATLSGSFNLAFEGDDDPVVQLEHVETESIPLDGKLYPVQPPCYYNGSTVKPAFVYNPESYVKSVHGDAVSVARIFTYRGQKAAEIQVSPLSYDPETNTATVIRRMELSVHLKKPAVVRSGRSREFDRIMRALFPNLEAVPAEPFDAREKYLIIAEPAYVNNADLKRLAEYRGMQYEVKLVSSAAIGDTTKEAYRNFIFHREHPTFCLLVGSSFPAWETHMWKSLNYYVASETGSPYQKPLPSIALGLFWVTHPAQLANIVNKTIATERMLAFRPRVVLGQGGNTSVMGALPEDHCDQVIQEVNERYFDRKTDFLGYSYASVPGGAQRAVDQFNQGCWFNIYNGHASTQGQAFGWGMSNLFSMKNKVYPFVLTCACLTGTFDQNCVAAVSLGFPYGPVTYIGAYDNSSIGQHVLNQGYPEAIMEQGITKNGLAFVYGVNYDSTPRAISRYSGQVSSGVKALMAWQYHHFGDPAIETMQTAQVPYFIGVTSPRGGDLIEQASTESITWGDNLCGNVRIDLYKGTTLLYTIAPSTESDGVFDWCIPKTLPAGNDYRIRVSSTHDATLWDSSATFNVIEPYLIELPYWLSFDDLDTGTGILPMKYEQSSTDDLDWVVWNGSTPLRTGDTSGMIGPASDHTSGYGKYLYVEASDSNSQGKTAEFVTPPFFLQNDGYNLSFWVHMTSRNRTLGSLAVDVMVDGAWRREAFVINGDQGPLWHQKVLNLDPYMGGHVRFRFRATTGSAGASDICLDDLRLEGAVKTAEGFRTVAGQNGMAIHGDRIHFSIPRTASAKPVSIVLYNAQGRMLQTLFNGAAVRGCAILPRNRLPAGMYIVSLHGDKVDYSTSLMITR